MLVGFYRMFKHGFFIEIDEHINKLSNELVAIDGRVIREKPNATTICSYILLYNAAVV